ncbi:MAG: 3-hydroxyacyl-CoA dehydrogenase, partial [Burkholderiales bacterium]|nr:3-hydroxyacyl-CoA dehydrogenase [Burkholderiales bacterium]
MPAAGIVGAGLIGRSWAHVFARAGWDVRVWDPLSAQRAQAASLVERSLHDLARHGLVHDPRAAARRLAIVDSLAEAVADADYVQESGPETVAAKRETFAALDAHARPETVLASSTSAIVASRFTEDLAGRDRC